MGIFSKLFGSGSSRESWSRISLNISKGLEDVRRTWFDSCVKGLQESSSEDIEVVNIHLGGSAELSIKAFQLYLTSAFLAQHAYIPRSQGRDFADILYAQVCGTKIEACMLLLSRYHEVQDGGTQVFRFASDVAEYIWGMRKIGNKASLREKVRISSTVPIFVYSNRVVVASCFGDEKTVSNLESELESELNNLESELNND